MFAAQPIVRKSPIAHRGFTMIELLVTIAVAAILTALAVPSFNSFVLNDRDIGQANSLVTSFNYARSEAVKQDLPAGITVCPSSDGNTCSGTAAWSGGWIVWDQNPADAPLQTVPAFGGSNRLTATGGGATGVQFRSSGMVNAPLTITICDARGASFARDVEVNATGRVAATQNLGQSVAGTALTCP
jgi:type IV fimbrial biogenesis protein FimT